MITCANINSMIHKHLALTLAVSVHVSFFQLYPSINFVIGSSSSSMCLPCADAVPIAQKINSWKQNATGIIPNDLDNPWNGNNTATFKIVAMGV